MKTRETKIAIVLVLINLVIFIFFAIRIKPNFFAFQNTLSASLVNQPIPQEKPKEQLKEVSLIAVGDIMLTRGVASKIAKYGIDYPFLPTRDYLKTGDIVFGNLETPISLGRKILPGEMLFRSDPGLEKELKNSNFSILSLANNHTNNFGIDGLEQTFQYLDEAGIKYAGAGKNIEAAYAPAIININGLRFAFLAFTDTDFTPASYEAKEKSAGVALLDQEKMSQAIEVAKLQSDFVIVSMHFGNEYQTTPSKKQKEFAHLAIDVGAEMVIGHHPHVVQPIEKYNNKYIFYSLGNFIFDQMWSLPTRQGAIAKIVFDSQGVKAIELQAVLIKDYCQPNIVTGAEAQSVLNILAFDKIKE